MGICYLCESNISIIDIILQKRCGISQGGINIGHVHKDCFILYNKYGRDYFVKKQYLEYNQFLSDYELTRILNIIDKKETTRNTISEQFGFKYEHVKHFCDFLVIKKRIIEKIDAQKPDVPTLPKII